MAGFDATSERLLWVSRDGRGPTRSNRVDVLPGCPMGLFADTEAGHPGDSYAPVSFFAARPLSL